MLCSYYNRLKHNATRFLKFFLQRPAPQAYFFVMENRPQSFGNCRNNYNIFASLVIPA